MNHNQFDYEHDLIFPLIEFLRRHTAYKFNETSNIAYHLTLYDIPNYVKEFEVKK